MTNRCGARARSGLARVLFLAVFFVLWEKVADAKLIDPILIGKPSGIVQYLWNEVFVTQSLLKDFYWSMAGTVIGVRDGQRRRHSGRHAVRHQPDDRGRVQSDRLPR